MPNGIVGWPAQSGGAGAVTSLGTATVAGAAATSLTVSSLDLSAYSAFQVIGKLKEATGGVPLVKLFYNSDTTDSNYHRASILHTVSLSGQRSNTAFLFNLPASGYADFSVLITSDVGGRPRARYDCVVDSTTSITGWTGAHTWVTAANVTGITIESSIASSLDIGSTITVYGIS